MNKLIISLLALFGVMTASAQNFVGTWELFPSYGTPNRIIETPEYVYTLTGAVKNITTPTGGSLSFYDKTTGEVGAMNTTNRLNANKVYDMWYSPADKCLFVLFEDFNIDLVYEDGRTISVPDLRDATISDDKNINDVAFAGGKAYVALRSGMIVIDMTHGAITESALWGKNIERIAASEKKLLIYSKTDNQVYFGNQAGSHHNFNNSFSPVASLYNIGAYNFIYLGNSKIFATDIARGYIFNVIEDKAIDDTPFYMTRLDDIPSSIEAGTVLPTRTGAMVTKGNDIYYIKSDGSFEKVTVNAISGNKVADWDADGKRPWLADATGFGEYDATAGAFTIARVKPKGTSGSNVGRIIQHPLTDEFYISTAEIHQNSTVYGLAFGKKGHADIYNSTTNTFTPIKEDYIPSSMVSFNVNPNDADIIFVGYFAKYLEMINIKNGNRVIFNNTNSSFSGVYNPTSINIDSYNNLWIFDNNSSNINKVLATEWTKKENWSSIEFPDIDFSHSGRMIIDEIHGVAIATGSTGIEAVKLPESDKPLTSACKTVFFDNATDADGSSLGGYKYPALAIDKNGWVWIGNDVGVMYIKDSREMFNSGFAVTRPKVSRNDGTNLADYLLNNVEVMCIAVDENNHKWIGTMGSGLYRVNEDGTEILEHLTTENSDIPSDNIFTVCPDRNSNNVYVGTADGLSIYHSTTAPAADDYKNVYAYPNPVTPDFTGYITITGLKADSLIKITDAAGNVFYETTSNGGMALWNGCDASGRRVRSGVYFVFASETGEDASDAAVTKIVVVN